MKMQYNINSATQTFLLYVTIRTEYLKESAGNSNILIEKGILTKILNSYRLCKIIPKVQTSENTQNV